MHIEHKWLMGTKPHLPGAFRATNRSLLLTIAVSTVLIEHAWGQRTTQCVGWGANGDGQINTTSNLTNVTQVACGSWHTYALNSDGTLVGWGYNGFGQTTTPSNLTNVTQVECGYSHTYALKNDGTLVGWGRSGDGEINTPSTLTNVAQVACGYFHTYALKNDGTLVGWGANAGGQTNTPSNLTNVTEVTCGHSHTYALKGNGTLVGWGDNGYGQINTPIDLSGVTQIACGGYHSYALKGDGTLVGWGYNGYGQTNTPSNATGVNQISCGSYHTFAVRRWMDCNSNGIFDSDEITFGGIIDLDQNGEPDTCQGAVQYLTDSGDLGAPNPVKPAFFTFTELFTADVDAKLSIAATGDFDASNEFLTVRLADSSNPLGYITLGRLFEVGGRNCSASSNAGAITVPKDTFNRLAANGQLTVILVPSPAVTLGECPNGSMSANLSYFGIGPDGDCDHDGRLDVRQIGEDQSIDSNLNSRIDNCEYAKGDFDLNGEVDPADLSLALLYLGETDSPFGDLDGDGTVTTADVSLLLLNFGPVTWP